MARASNPGVSKATTPKRARAPQPPQASRQMPDRQQVRGPQQQFQYGAPATYPEGMYFNTFRPAVPSAAPVQVTQNVSPFARQAQAGPSAVDLYSRMYANALQRGPAMTTRVQVNPSMTPSYLPNTNPAFFNGVAFGPTMGAGPQPNQAYYQQQQARLAATPNPRQYQYGYAPVAPNQYPTTLPDTLRGQATRIVDNMRGSMYTDRLWGGAIGDIPYSPEMAYARAPQTRTPAPGGGGGYSGWTDYYGGGGGGGGYTNKPEWMERMINWKF